MKNRYAFQSFFAAAGVFAALTASCAASADPGTPVRGQVTAVDATAKTVTLTNPRTQATTVLHTNDATKYLVDATGALSDLKVGQTIRVIGQAVGTAITARAIQLVPDEEASLPTLARGGRRGGVTGVIASVTPTLTITLPDKTTDTVQTDATTRVTVPRSGTLADVKPQSNVNGITTGAGDAAVATEIHVRAAGGYGRGGGAPAGQ